MSVSVLLDGCTPETLIKRSEKKLDEDYKRMLHAAMNKSCKQHPTKQQLYDYSPPISQVNTVRRIRHAGTAGDVRTNSKMTSSYGRTSAD